MKMLNEVIDAMERCSIPHYFDCKGCPYEDDDAEVECKSDDRDADVLYYLRELAHYLAELDNPDGEHQQLLKCQSLLQDFYRNKPSLGESPNYIPLDFHQLAEMIGEPVYIKDNGCRGHWEIVTMVRKTVDGEDVGFRGYNQWQRVGKNIYRTKEGAEQ